MLLVLLALVPLAGASWFTLAEFNDIRRVRAQSDQVEVAVRDLARLTELQSALLDERNWSGVVSGMDSIGVPVELVTRLTDIDVENELLTAKTRVDILVGELELDAIGEELRRVRNSPPVTVIELGELYIEIEVDLADQSNALYEELLDEASNVTDGNELVSTLRVLDAATDARQAIAGQQTAYFTARFSPGQTGPTDLRSLTEELAFNADALRQVRAVAAPDSAVNDALDALDASVDVAFFRQEVDSFVMLAYEDGLADATSSLQLILTDAENVAAEFRAGSRSAAAHLDLVDAAATDVENAGRRLSADADTHARTAALTALAVVVTSLAFAIAVGRVVAKPLRELATAAQRLRDGETGTPIRPSGPAEVRAAALAINEASIHLELAERQATALAQGRLDHEVLGQTAQGALGRSLQHAVQTLARSLTEREGFRLRLAHEAEHDALTGLPNRKACLARLTEGLVEKSGHLAALFIDLDGFKDINDDHGHQAGDAVLVATARRLQASVRQHDHVGRLGGDEFLVVANPVGTQEEAINLAERLLAAIVEPIETTGVIVRVEASIGIAIPGVRDRDPDELIREADLALYEAKAAGRGRVVICDDRLLASKDEQLAMEVALRKAISCDELTMYYQPIVDAATHSIASLEALVRWQVPGRRIVGPDRFIPVAERSELITHLDRWVVASVVEQLHQWRDHPVLGAVPVAVNMSGRTLGSEHLVEAVMEPLQRFDIDPRRLMVEVTESALLEDLETAAIRLQTLRANGVRVAIDDYGTGFTSLAHLRALPIDVLKIDRTFVADESAASLTKLIIDTGHLLGAAVTAEGVETPEQAQLLRNLGTDQLQGFLFGRPSSPRDFTAGPGELDPMETAQAAE